MQTDPSEKPRLRWFQYSLLKLLLAVAACSVIASCCAWWLRRVESGRTAKQIEATIDSLTTRRPSSMPQEQWEIAIWWTSNLAGNSQLPFQADLNDLRRFQQELEEKTKGEIDMATIFWIWDRHAQLTLAGKKYQKFRQQMLDQMHWTPGPFAPDATHPYTRSGWSASAKTL